MVSSMLSRIRLLWAREEGCLHALFFFPSARLSHSLGLLDALIGATVIGLNGTLYSFNQKHFQSIPQLEIVAPYAR